MNKGLELCSGHYVIMLNSGDIFANKNVLEKMFIEKKNETTFKKVLFGRAIINKKGDYYRLPPLKYSNKNISRWLKYSVPNHQAMFFPKQFYLNNRFDLRLTISADSDYKIRALNDVGYEFVNLDVVKFRFGGISSSYSNVKVLLDMLHDTWIINMKHRSFFFAIYRITVNTVKYLVSKILGKKILFKLSSRKSS